MSIFTASTTSVARDGSQAQGSKTASFIEEKSLTFTIANTGGVAVVSVAGLIGFGVDGQLVAWVAGVLGVLVTVIGTPWVKPKPPEPQGLEYVRRVLGQLVIGVLNTALLAVALWGSLTVLEAAIG